MRAILLVCTAVLATLVGACSDSEAAKQRFFESGNRYFAQKQYREAVVEYRNAIRQDPRFGEARYRLAEAYAQLGNAEAAYSEQIRAADLLPDNTEVQLKAAAYLLLTSQFEEAKARAVKVLERDPRNVQALVILGNASAGMSDVIGAIAEIQQAIEIDPSRSGSYTNLGSLRLAQGDREQARTAFLKAVEIEPASVTARLGLAMFQWGTDDLKGAEQSLKTALALDAGHLLANRALASYYLSTGRATEAESYLKTLAAAGGDTEKMTLADYYIRADRPNDARRLLEVVARTDGPSATEAQMRLAAVAYQANRIAEAHTALDKVLADEPANSAALLLKASWLNREGQTQAAMERAHGLVAADPRSAPAHYLLGTIQVQARDFDGAAKSFNEVLRLNPRATDAQMQLSRLALARGDTSSAIWRAQEAGKNSTGSPEPSLILSRAFLAQGQTARAESELSALLKQYPDDSGVHALNAALKVLKKDFSGARLEYERALKLEPGSIDALTGLAMLEIAQNKAPAAGARMETFLSTSPDRPEVLALAARVFVASKDFAKAETLLRRLIEVDRNSMIGYSLLGQVYLIQEKLEPAKVEFENRARLNPKDATARLMVAMILETQQNIGEAKKKYEEVLALDSRSVIAANNLAYLYAETGQDLDRALSLAQTAAEQSRDNAAVQDTLGWIYYHKAVPDLAILAFEKSTAKEPDNPVYRYHLGLAYAKRGDFGRARLSFEAALKIKPDYAEAQQALKSLRG